MAINPALVLAGISAGGTSKAELAWFAPTGTTAPADATTALNAAFKSAGLVSEDGLTKDLSNDSNDIKAYGVAAPVRKIITSEEVAFKLSFLETNVVSLSIYNRLPLTGTDSITVADGGLFTITEGTFRSQRYAFVAEILDDTHRMRVYAPSVEVTEKESFNVKAGESIPYGVTLTAYPNSSGISVETFYVLPELDPTP